MLQRGYLESSSVRLLIACALSLAAHALLILNLPFEIMPTATSAPPHQTKISVEFRVPEAPPRMQESTSPTLAPELPVTTMAPPEKNTAISEPARALRPVESLRTAWRAGASQGSGQGAPIRLTDQPGLPSEARAYLASWQREVQRVGRLNFPTDDDGNRIRGSLRLLVGIHPDGSLAYVQVTESSRNARLDAAAQHIVELAAPFAPLPQSLRRGDAPLEIDRTWRIGASLVRL